MNEDMPSTSTSNPMEYRYDQNIFYIFGDHTVINLQTSEVEGRFTVQWEFVRLMTDFLVLHTNFQI